MTKKSFNHDGNEFIEKIQKTIISKDLTDDIQSQKQNHLK